MTSPEAPEITLLRRTLHDVAASLDVPDAPLPPEAARPPGHRRPVGWRAPLAVAAAIVVLAAGVWAVLRSTDGADDTAPADDVTTDPGPSPRAGWLPDGVAPARTGSTTGMPVEAARLLEGSGRDDVAVVVEVGGGTDVGERVASYVGPYVGAPAGTGQAVSSGAPGASTAALWRRLAPPPGTLTGTSVSGWTGEDVDLSWVPGVGDTTSVAYEGGGSAGSGPALVELHAVAGSLPELSVIAALLDDEAQVTVRGHLAWFVPLIGPGAGHAVLWQAAPGVVHVVTGWWVAEADLLRVAEESTWPDAVTVGETRFSPTTGVGERVLAGPEDWPTLCGPRPGDPVLPGEDTGESSSGLIGVTGTDDVPYDLLLWEDRVTAGGPERTGACWRLAIGVQLPQFRGGGEVVTQGWGPVTTLVPVHWTSEETVFFAAATTDVTFLSEGDVVVTPLGVRMEDGTRFTFIRVARSESPEIGFEVRDAQGRVVAQAGPLPMDRPG